MPKFVDQNEVEVKTWLSKLRDRIVEYLQEYGNEQVIMVVELHRIVREVNDDASKNIDEIKTSQQQLQTLVSKDTSIETTIQLQDQQNQMSGQINLPTKIEIF